VVGGQCHAPASLPLAIVTWYPSNRRLVFSYLVILQFEVALNWHYFLDGQIDWDSTGAEVRFLLPTTIPAVPLTLQDAFTAHLA